MFIQIKNKLEGIVTIWIRIRINGHDRMELLTIQEHDDYEEDLLVTLMGKCFTVSKGESDTTYGDLVIWEGNQIGEQQVFGRAIIYDYESELFLEGKLIYKYSRIVLMGSTMWLKGIATVFMTIL